MTAEREIVDMADEAFARKGRITAGVIATAAMVSILAPWIVNVMGWAARFEILIYFMSLAAFVWAMFNIYQLWRLRQAGDRADTRASKSTNQR